MSKEERTKVRRIRIAVSEEGKVLTWTPTLNARNDFFNGWRTIYSDGTIEDELDKAEAVELSKENATARERKLIDENAKLMEMLADAGIPIKGKPAPPKLSDDKPIGKKVVAKVESEDTIPIIDNENDLTNPLPTAEDNTISFQPEVEDKTKTQLSRMKVENLIVHAHDLKRDVDLPDGASRKELVGICLDLQKERKAKGE